MAGCAVGGPLAVAKRMFSNRRNRRPGGFNRIWRSDPGLRANWYSVRMGHGMSTDNDILKAHWLPYEKALLRRWPQLRERDLMSIGGDVDRLKARLRDVYGFTEPEAQRAVDAWYADEGGGRA